MYVCNGDTQQQDPHLAPRSSRHIFRRDGEVELDGLERVALGCRREGLPVESARNCPGVGVDSEAGGQSWKGAEAYAAALAVGARLERASVWCHGLAVGDVELKRKGVGQVLWRERLWRGGQSAPDLAEYLKP